MVEIIVNIYIKKPSPLFTLIKKNHYASIKLRFFTNLIIYY